MASPVKSQGCVESEGEVKDAWHTELECFEKGKKSFTSK